ncbi:MAG: hypothetical protein J7621_23300 [Niastella sp.]|nr:hypothetical protein [Niastella sp.]
MKHHANWKLSLSAFIIASVVFMNCSKEPSGLPDDPPINNPGKDTTKPRGGTDTSGNGPGTGGPGVGINDSSGVTLMRGAGGASLYHDSYYNTGKPTSFLSQDGYASKVHLNFDSAALIRIKLVNADLGTMTVTPRVNNSNYTHVEIDFSNANYYTADEQVIHPDTVKKLQIWFYREDGKNMIPAEGTRPPVKRIIYVPGRFPSDPDIGGLIRLLDYDYPGYPVRPPAVTLPILQQIFTTSRWKLYKFIWPSF